MKCKAMLFNGLSSVGKDEAVKSLLELDYSRSINISVFVEETKHRLFEATQQIFKITANQFFEIYNDRKTKETPFWDFSVTMQAAMAIDNIVKVTALHDPVSKLHTPKIINGILRCPLTIREAMIFVSELFFKPVFGRSYFGQERADSVSRIVNSVNRDILILDGSMGFTEELPPLVKLLGAENIMIVRVYKDDVVSVSDSRKYVDENDPLISGIKVVDIHNVHGELEDFKSRVKTLAIDFLKS